MIPFDFDYYAPSSVNEAFSLYHELDAEGMQPLYYSGGTEIISMARVNNIRTKAVIDLKKIQDCNRLETSENCFAIGSCNTLSRIMESKKFPLFDKTAGRIADHTNQCKITLGGNLNSTIIYRETALPFLLCDGTAVILRNGQPQEFPFSSLFKKRLQLNPGEFVIEMKVKTDFISLPFVHVKKTKNEKIDYPLFTIAAIRVDNNIRIAFSGLTSYPFRSLQVENALNQPKLPKEERVGEALRNLPRPILNDVYGSDKFRIFSLKNTLLNVLKTLEDSHNAKIPG